MRILFAFRKIIGIFFFACIVIFALSLFGANKPNGEALPTLAVLPSLTWTPETETEIATEPPGVTIIPTEVINRSGFVTITPAPGTVYPTATITDTPQPTATNTDIPTAIPTVGEIAPVSGMQDDPNVMVIEPLTYYAERQVNVRACPRTDCERLGQVAALTGLTVDAIVNGEEVEPKNLIWYRVAYGGKQGFVYSGLMLAQLPKPPTTIPVQAPIAVQQPPAQQVAPSGYTGPIPKNCAEARAMGIDQYTAAQINPKLDRDNDGKACYDDQ